MVLLFQIHRGLWTRPQHMSVGVMVKKSLKAAKVEELDEWGLMRKDGRIQHSKDVCHAHKVTVPGTKGSS